MDDNFIKFTDKNKGGDIKRLPLGVRIFVIIIFDIIYLLVNWKNSGNLNFKDATPADTILILFIATFGGAIFAFSDYFPKALSFLFYQPSSNFFIKLFYCFVAFCFIAVIIIIILIIVFYNQIFYGDMFKIFFH